MGQREETKRTAYLAKIAEVFAEYPGELDEAETCERCEVRFPSAYGTCVRDSAGDVDVRFCDPCAEGCR
jgi:hypothetical protein